MRLYFTFLFLTLIPIISLSQSLTLEKASPFTAVKWEDEEPIVQFENDWYHLEKLSHLSKQEILSYCKNEFGEKWKKRFSEDLVEVLLGMGYQPEIKVDLLLSQNGISKSHVGTFSFENRQKVLKYNQDQAFNKFPQSISPVKAVEDLRQFEEILKSVSSYSQLSNFDYSTAIQTLSASILERNENVEIDRLAHEMAKIMVEIGDRHSSVKNEALNMPQQRAYQLKLPFGLAPINGKVVALQKGSEEGQYSYLFPDFPYLKSINGMSVDTLIHLNYRDKKAPRAAKMSRGLDAIQHYGKLMFSNNLDCPDSITAIFKNDTEQKTVTFKLTSENQVYQSLLEKVNQQNQKEVDEGDLKALRKILDDNIGYISLPAMYHYDEIEGLEAFVKDTFREFSDTKALIVDVRNNPGGGRELLQTFAEFIVQPEQSPWVANIAYLRTEKPLNADEESMSGRYLYTYSSEKFTDADRQAIDAFNSNFEPKNSFDTSKFSSPFYMVLHKGKNSYEQPVYILANEQSFSAATVFVSAFKGLSNVKIVGETTDGSSGNSVIRYLKNSKIRVKTSTMLSYQRNGQTLDAYGTLPDVTIHVDEVQVIKGVDYQLVKLIQIINNLKQKF